MGRTLILILLIVLGLGGLFFALRPDSTVSGPVESPDTGTASSPDSTASDSAGEPREQVLDVSIRGNTMSPDEISVGEGDRVTLRMTSDSPTEVHLHGYDLEEEIEPGEPAELSFEATITGRFEIENHNTDAVLGVLLVQPR